MGLLQSIISLLPGSWGSHVRSESEKWFMVCGCGHPTNVWAAGGIRYKASGKPTTVYRCPKCGLSSHKFEYRG